MIQFKNKNSRNGFVLPLVIIVVVILSALAIGLMLSSYLVRFQSIKAKNETEAMLAAEAGYEQAIYWMALQPDILSSLQNGGNSGTINFEGSSCTYEVDFDNYVGARPVFRILSQGTCGVNSRIVDVAVVQETTGWVMGKCRIPSGTDSTNPVNFADGEILDIPIHINNLKDNPDNIDIYIVGAPQFKQKVEMGEPRNVNGTGGDKYGSVIGLFQNGIYFDQPDVRITDEAAVKSKVIRFRDSTDPLFRFVPVGTAKVSDLTKAHNAIQIEFFIENNVGMVQITNNCTVQTTSGNTYDYNTVPNTSSKKFQKYNIYAYHYAPQNVAPIKKPVTDTYVSQKFGSKESEPGGQIFVDGDVVIGGDRAGTDIDQILKGKMTIVATGNIWIADSIKVGVPGEHDPVTGLPLDTNLNVLGLISQRVVKIVDPGLSTGASTIPIADRFDGTKKHIYKPIANGNVGSNNRSLPHNMVVEAAVTVGGGGWGAENVGSRSTVGPGKNDFLVLRGSISECVRGIVGYTNSNGFLKQYYLDKRLMTGILPGDIWFGGKYVPAPAGWHDYRPEN